tara:strand:- start:350 stop:811 length:462 start_codon:yes stop_codon:yes gene_type:complete
VNHTAAGLNVWYPCQEFFIYHLQTTGRCQYYKDSQIEQILLLKFFDTGLLRKIVGIGLLHQARWRSSIYLIGAQMAEFLFDKALSVLVVFELVLEDLDEGVVLVKSRLHFLLVSEDVGKACGEFCTTFAVEDYLGSADVAVGYTLLVHEIEGS